MAEGDIFKATVICEGNLGTAFVFDFGYYDNNTGSFIVDTGTAAGDFQTLVQAKFAACLPDAVTFKKYRFACVGGPNAGQIGYVDVDPPVTGDLSGIEYLPAEIAISLKRSTGFASRRDRGRIFFGPCNVEMQNSDNNDLVEVDGNLTALRDLLKANLTTQTRVLKPVILSADGTPPAHIVTKVAIGPVFVHHKSRRFRAGS